MIDEAVSKLVTYALRTGLIQENETVWAVNTILDALKLDSYTDPGKEWEELELAPILETTPTPGACWRKTPWCTGICSTPS